MESALSGSSPEARQLLCAGTAAWLGGSNAFDTASCDSEAGGSGEMRPEAGGSAARALAAQVGQTGAGECSDAAAARDGAAAAAAWSDAVDDEAAGDEAGGAAAAGTAGGGAADDAAAQVLALAGMFGGDAGAQR